MDVGRLVMVIVPAFNEGKAVKATVELLLAAGYRVVVVDDGSTDETADVGRLPVVYLRHAVNLGQGAALQTGMTYALRAGAEIAVHFDADGQHDCAQIERLIAPIAGRTGGRRLRLAVPAQPGSRTGAVEEAGAAARRNSDFVGHDRNAALRHP